MKRIRAIHQLSDILTCIIVLFSAVKAHEQSNHLFWSKWGEVLIYEICGTYLRKYHKTLMNEDKIKLIHKHKILNFIKLIYQKKQTKKIIK